VIADEVLDEGVDLLFKIPEDAKSADIVVITAGAGVKPRQTRLDLVQLIFNCSPKTHNTKRPSSGCCSGTFNLLARKSDLDRRATPRCSFAFF
jgi:hypothetical protein